MEIKRENLKEQFLGESKAKLSDGEGEIEIETPTSAANLQEVYHKEEFNGIYKLEVCLPNKIFNMNPFIDTRDNISGKKAIDYNTEEFNKWLKKSQAFVSIFAPKYSSELTNYGTQAKYTSDISAYSNASFITVPETPNINSSKKAIEKAKNLNLKRKV